jgi:hypothetical protein
MYPTSWYNKASFSKAGTVITGKIGHLATTDPMAFHQFQLAGTESTESPPFSARVAGPVSMGASAQLSATSDFPRPAKISTYKDHYRLESLRPRTHQYRYPLANDAGVSDEGRKAASPRSVTPKSSYPSSTYQSHYNQQVLTPLAFVQNADGVAPTGGISSRLGVEPFTGLGFTTADSFFSGGRDPLKSTYRDHFRGKMSRSLTPRC